MAQPLSDYFALEAGEYLDQLDALLTRGERPDFQQLFRLARGVRGSAQIAGAGAIAGVAERLEGAARALRDGEMDWDETVRQRAVRTIDDVRVLVRATGAWGEAEDARAREAAARWGDGAPRRAAVAAAGGDQLYGFVQREIAGVVAELDRVVGELAEAPSAREPLRGVLRRMRPVRGVAGLGTLAPVLEVLEGIEDTAQEVLTRAASVGERHLDLLRAAGAALQAAGRVLEGGEAPGDSPELDRFRDARDHVAGGDPEAGVVPVSSLFHDDAGPHLLSSPLAPHPGRGAAEVPLEVESFLRIEAAGFLDRAEALVADLAGRRGRPGRVTHQLAELGVAVHELARTYGLADIARAAETAAERLRVSGDAESARRALADLRAAIPGLPGAPRLVPEPTDAPEAAEPEESPEEEGVVPVTALEYAPSDALREALALRGRVEALAGEGARRGTPLGDTIDELFALVELGLKGRESAAA